LLSKVKSVIIIAWINHRFKKNKKGSTYVFTRNLRRCFTNRLRNDSCGG